MKKGFYITVFFISLFFVTQQVFACSVVEGATYPTPESVLVLDDTAIGVYRINSDGPSTTGTLIIGNENSIMNMVFEIDTSSCGTRSQNFAKDEYIVTIFNKNDTKIHHVDFDSQFSYSFQTKEEAFLKFDELTKIWENRSLLKDSGKKVYYIPSDNTLKPGMVNKEVLNLQHALKIKLGLGNDFKLDGSYGPATVSAVKQFQRSEGLEDDGIAGVLTQKALSGENQREESHSESDSSKNVSYNEEENVEDTEINDDILDGEIKKILTRAKNDFINRSHAGYNYNEAYTLVVKYNGDLLAVSESSDPLYKSSGGGQYFIYFAKLSNGKYACVDSSMQKELVEKDTKPDTTAAEVSC